MNVEQNLNAISEESNSTSSTNNEFKKKIFSTNDLVELLQTNPKKTFKDGVLGFFLFAAYSWFLLWLGTFSFCTPVVILKYLNVTSIS